VAVGQLARSARKQLGLTQNDVAKRAGLHSASVYAIEGATANPTLHNLRLLASALEIDVADLFPRRGAAELALPAVQASEFAERISRLEEQVAGLAQRLDATAGPRRRKPGSKL
jgi:transcriptional regulator with XRE-family HTH domain